MSGLFFSMENIESMNAEEVGPGTMDVGAEAPGSL